MSFNIPLRFNLITNILKQIQNMIYIIFLLNANDKKNTTYYAKKKYRNKLLTISIDHISSSTDLVTSIL